MFFLKKNNGLPTELKEKSCSYHTDERKIKTFSVNKFKKGHQIPSIGLKCWSDFHFTWYYAMFLIFLTFAITVLRAKHLLFFYLHLHCFFISKFSVLCKKNSEY